MLYSMFFLDDILIARKNETLTEMITCFRRNCDLKDLGEVNNYLDIEIHKTD